MTIFTSSDREVINALFEAEDWLDTYDLHKNFRLSPGQIIDILDRMIGGGLAERNGLFARLTPDGREWVVASRRAIFFDTDRDAWRPEASVVLGEALSPDQPYLPDPELIDRSFYTFLEVQSKRADANKGDG